MPSSPRPRSLKAVSLAAKLGTVGALLMSVALGSIALTLWVTWQLEGGAAAVNEAGRLRMQTWRLAQAVSVGDGARVQQLAAQFDASLALLRAGDPARPLFVPSDAATRAAFAQVQADWQRARALWLLPGTTQARTGHEPSLAAGAAGAAADAEALVRDIDEFVGDIESRLARWTALLTIFQLTLVGLAIAAGVALLYSAHLFVFRPLAALQQGLGAVERGDLATRVQVPERATQDEFGRLGQGFNRMAARLAESYRGLEQKVAEKTDTLRAERERLAVLYEASRFVARTPTLRELADGFAERVRRVAHADAALLRWNDGAKKQLVLLATRGVPDELVAAEQCVQHGQCHCGQSAAAAGQAGDGARPGSGARVIEIAPADHGHAARPCQRAGFAHVMTLPVRLQDQWLGEVDLLYRERPEPLSPEDGALLESLASHLASGMEGVRLAALEREAAVSEERSLIARELHDSIAQALAFMKIQIQLLRTSLRKGDRAKTDEVVGELDAGVRESMADVRELLMHFRTRAQGDDIVPALKTTLQKFHHQAGLQTHLDVQGEGVPLAPDVQVQVLHVVQEALSNVRKHAGASQVWLTVQQHPRWRIEVRDDGAGFDAAAARAADETHVGLRIMRERAAGIGADVVVESRRGDGTRVVLQWPEAGPRDRSPEETARLPSAEQPDPAARRTTDGQAAPQTAATTAAVESLSASASAAPLSA
ncbi:MAG: type IV pili methyl-accepting chemotaxis transducer N-terminal domain-containing protein [Rubrivivax sp.]|nr:type IV pili methyl-accepting chemotaxis transducer N-terminal domain-containing protein [Rubrivivax sp.]